ncbi:MAG TPA: DUF72 domain-containing protein [Candidatus Hypogeohydataceae bacterium YC41]
MEKGIKVGCCGFPVSRTKYYQTFPVVELQQTFYQLPMLKTAERWRQESPERFEFTMKVSQLITHETTSPTYRRYKIPIPEEKKKNYGSFKPTAEVLEAWEKTKEVAQALEARVLVFQCPPSFAPTAENKENFRQFFSCIERENFLIVWEPRGDWNPAEIKELCMKLNLVHGVDPFKNGPLYGKARYFRLHGKTSYSYCFTKEDLHWLKKKWAMGTVYYMFNNVAMLEDSQRFMALLKD